MIFDLDFGLKSCVKNRSIIFLVVWVFKKEPGFLRTSSASTVVKTGLDIEFALAIAVIRKTLLSVL